jgi:tellurite resistance protein
MLYQLKNLTESEQQTVLNAPIWVTLLIACADHDIDEKEIDRAKEIVHIKSFAEQNDVKELYQELDAQMDERIDSALKSLSAIGKDRLKLIEANLASLNSILPKLDANFATQLHSSLQNLAVYVAQSDGGVFGINRISDEENEYLKLPMITKP